MSLSDKERQLMEVSEHYKQQIVGFEEQLKVLQQKAVRLAVLQILMWCMFRMVMSDSVVVQFLSA